MALRPSRPQSRAEQLAAARALESQVFMREVDEAVRGDQAMEALRRWGKPVGAAVLAGLLGLGGWLLWTNHQSEAQAKRAEQLTIALDQLDAGRYDLVSGTIAPIAASGHDASAAEAQLLQAGVAIKQNQTAKAISLFTTLANDSAAPKPLRDLANIRAVALQFDQLKPEEVIARLKPLAEPGDAWFGSAGELVGLAYLKLGQKNLAGPLFVAIAKDKDTPDSLRARTRQLAGQLGYDAMDDIASVSAPAAAGQ